MMITEQTQAALLRLYALAGRAADVFELDRVDRALDEVLRLNSDQPAAFQVRSALANASKVLRHRRSLAVTTPLGEILPQYEPRACDDEVAQIDVLLWLQRSSALTNAQREVLQLLCSEQDSAGIAQIWGAAPGRVREHVSRARRAARSAYEHEVLAA
jgi:DNA-binding CsgD family transcriptional regulator